MEPWWSTRAIIPPYRRISRATDSETDAHAYAGLQEAHLFWQLRRLIAPTALLFYRHLLLLLLLIHLPCRFGALTFDARRSQWYVASRALQVSV